MRNIGTTASAAALVMVATTLTACGTSSTGHPQPAAVTVARTTPSHPAAVVPATVPDNPRLRTAVHITGCEALPDRTGWQATGTVTNNTAKPADYHITIFFTTNKATDVGFADTTATANPGETTKWTASKKLSAPSTLTCVLRAVG